MPYMNKWFHSAPTAILAAKAGLNIKLGNFTGREDRLYVKKKKKEKEKKRDEEYLRGRKISRGKMKLGRKKSVEIPLV